MKGYIVILVVILCFVLSPLCSNVDAEERGNVCQKDFIVHLVMAMKMENFLPQNPLIGDYIRLLEERGITIPGGYKPDDFITAKQMAIMLIPAMGLDKSKYERLKEQISSSYKDRAFIINIVGDVKIRQKGAEEWNIAKPGIFLAIEDMIRTGEASSAIIRLGQISIAKVRENTTVSVYQLAKNPIIYIEDGDILLDTGSKKHVSNYYVITPTTVAAVRGTIIKAVHRQGITTVLVAEGKTEVYNVPQYTLGQKVEMARKDKMPVSPVEAVAGNYVREDKIYPLSDEEKRLIDKEVNEIEIAANTSLFGSAAEEMLEEKGVNGEDYMKIDILDKRASNKNVARVTDK